MSNTCGAADREGAGDGIARGIVHCQTIHILLDLDAGKENDQGVHREADVDLPEAWFAYSGVGVCREN